MADETEYYWDEETQTYYYWDEETQAYYPWEEEEEASRDGGSTPATTEEEIATEKSLQPDQPAVLKETFSSQKPNYQENVAAQRSPSSQTAPQGIEHYQRGQHGGGGFTRHMSLAEHGGLEGVLQVISHEREKRAATSKSTGKGMLGVFNYPPCIRAVVCNILWLVWLGRIDSRLLVILMSLVSASLLSVLVKLTDQDIKAQQQKQRIRQMLASQGLADENLIRKAEEEDVARTDRKPEYPEPANTSHIAVRQSIADVRDEIFRNTAREGYIDPAASEAGQECKLNDPIGW